MRNRDSEGVSEWFAGRSVFVTGGTGFMGKVLVEKLLRSCPGVKNIFLLMRPKRGQDVSARLADLLNAPLFNRVREERPSDLEKIVPINGDITLPELGISPADQQRLAQCVSVVFHSAATVKFDEALKLSVTINILGTKRLVHLCHSMINLEALIHVSTAYCNCDRYEVKEEIYPPPYDPEHIIQAMEWMDDELIQTLTPKLIGNRPNTYTFTKALTEHMLLKESGNLPVAIVRPSIVISSVREPMAGWVDNWNGPTGIIAAAGKGFFRTMLCHENKAADLVPVDIVINLMICAAWKTATTRPSGIMVYNCCTGQKAPITWKKFVQQCFESMRKHPLGDLMWYPDGKARSSRLINALNKYTLHYVPAYLLDAVSWAVGRKPIMVSVQKKLDKAVSCLIYFSTREWKFLDDNVLALNSSLSQVDREAFPFDVRQIKWPLYIEDYVLGIRQFIFKEPPSSIPKARKQLTKFYILHRTCQLLMMLLLWRLVMMRFNGIAKKYFFQFLDIVLRLTRLIPGL
ncbi:putative fatty acyl-CoA reductase CG5065 [Halyomorpha halys]|uniref:putative fatty acyl-CoA reductase CG5065 n=1 Tax=Halyomorpha halys TaxID=286706 RepID=UPI0006D522A4|nr:putative fatty acyl-CoA reductase CG5065 [Halyomorpha halys]XP_024218277.1 putative fatty acyl-CoA reductase CG5065 [Halyomorpha halys]XP_024218278.1 putative fatty acyl-CoA reductase CG5065 [Halyomorpha halys]